MIDETAVVERVTDDEVVFHIVKSGACEACAIREECFRNDGLLSVPSDHVYLAGGRRRNLVARATVSLRITNSSVLGITGLVYGVPLLLFLGGILAGYLGLFSGAQENLRALGSFGVGTAALAISAWVIRILDRRIARSLRYEVTARSAVASRRGGEAGTERASRGIDD